MASPMRKRRDWSTRTDDAESKETAAFEATVAAAKDTAAKSGAFLSTAKSDLTDHQKWLHAQSAAVERDRARHDRWLNRQRESRDALARRERTKRRRQLMRQRAFRGIRQAVGAAVAWIAVGVTFLASLAARGVAWLGAQLSALFVYIAQIIGAAARWTGAKLSVLGLWLAAKTGATARASGRAIATGSSLAASKAGVLGQSAGRSLGSGLSAASTRGSALLGAAGRSASRGLATSYAWAAPRVAALSPALAAGMGKLGHHAQRYAKAGAAGAQGLFERAGVTVPAGDEAKRVDSGVGTPQTAVPEVYGPFPDGFRINGVSLNEPQLPAPEPVAPRVKTKNALSIRAGNAWARAVEAKAALAEVPWAQGVRARTRGTDLSQMLIIAGTVLLICGGLLLGGGLFLRAGAGTTPQAGAAEDEPHGIAWSFEEADRPLPERAVFTLSGTPSSFRINGLSLSGTNLSDQPLTGVEGVLKPDVKRPDLKLTLSVDKTATPIAEGDTEGQALDIVPQHTVPPQAPFRLVFPFPPEAMGGEEGLTVDEYFESYGGLLLKLRFEVDGQERSLIQYLPPELLKSQLDEVAAEAGG